MVEKWGAKDVSCLASCFPPTLWFVLSCFECTFTPRYGFDGEWQNSGLLIPDDGIMLELQLMDIGWVIAAWSQPKSCLVYFHNC
jgi:hypothetical protein